MKWRKGIIGAEIRGRKGDATPLHGRKRNAGRGGKNVSQAALQKRVELVEGREYGKKAKRHVEKGPLNLDEKTNDSTQNHRAKGRNVFRRTGKKEPRNPARMTSRKN